MRINKLFSNLGICSRKETNNLIENNRVMVNGKTAVKGQWIQEEDIILLDGRPLKRNEKIYIAFNKPRGIVCTNSKEVSNNIIDYLNYNKYIFPVGRLDKDSEGLIILTNDGEYADKLINCEEHHEKEYIVTVNKDLDSDFLEKIRNGVLINNKESSGLWRISDTVAVKKIIDNDGNTVLERKVIADESKEPRNNKVMTRKCQAYPVDKRTFRIILTQGLNRQIRKMCSSLGYEVTKLKRIRIAEIKLGNLKTGETRNLTESEINLQSKDS